MAVKVNVRSETGRFGLIVRGRGAPVGGESSTVGVLSPGFRVSGLG